MMASSVVDTRRLLTFVASTSSRRRFVRLSAKPAGFAVTATARHSHRRHEP